MKDFFSKTDQIRRNLRIWSHLLKNSVMENFISRAVSCVISIRFVGTKIERKCMEQKCLRILTGKKHPKIKLQRLRKIRISTFGSLVNQLNTF